MHRSLFSGELRQAIDRFALVDEEIIELVHDQAGEVQFAGDNGVVDTLQDEADEKTPLPESKIRPILREVLTAVKPQCQGICKCCHVLSAKAGATFTWFCLRVMSREEISSPVKR